MSAKVTNKTISYHMSYEVLPKVPAKMMSKAEGMPVYRKIIFSLAKRMEPGSDPVLDSDSSLQEIPKTEEHMEVSTEDQSAIHSPGNLSRLAIQVSHLMKGNFYTHTYTQKMEEKALNKETKNRSVFQLGRVQLQFLTMHNCMIEL